MSLKLEKDIVRILLIKKGLLVLRKSISKNWDLFIFGRVSRRKLN
jgi:hypothetical protein